MVTVPHKMVRIERILDYRDVTVRATYWANPTTDMPDMCSIQGNAELWFS